MDIVLGVSMTPTTVRMVLVDGEKADGATIEHDTLDIVAAEGAAATSATDHVIAAILGTREGAVAGGHRLSSTGVAWSDHAEAAELREALAARGIDGVTLVSELQAAAALAQAAGGLVGYDKTALLHVGRDTATLAVVDTADGSIVKVDSRPVTEGDAMAVVSDMVTSLRGHPSEPNGMFVVGSDHDVAGLKEHVKDLVSIPVSAPSDAAMALARGAALAAANFPDPDASTTALAYSQDPDLTTGPRAYTEADLVAALNSPGHQSNRKPFMLVGSTMAAVFMVGVVALVISLAVSIRPTVDSRPSPGSGVIPPDVAAPAAPTVENAKPPAPPPAAVPPPAAPAPLPPAAVAPPAAELPPIAPPVLAAQQSPPVVHAPVVRPKPAQVVAPAAAPAPPAAPPPAAAPPAPVPAAPAPAPAAVPGYPQTGYPPGYGGAPAYGPGPGYGPAPAYGPGPGYGPAPAYGPGPGYGPAPAYGPGPGYGPEPAYGPGYGPGPGYERQSPAIPIIPGVLGIGPRPAPRWSPSGPGYGRGFGRGPSWLWSGG
jgi:hypothetical protein